MPPLPKTPTADDHDKWLEDQVEIALKEADDPETVWIENALVRKDWQAKRAALSRRLAEQDKSA